MITLYCDEEIYFPIRKDAPPLKIEYLHTKDCTGNCYVAGMQAWRREALARDANQMIDHLITKNRFGLISTEQKTELVNEAVTFIESKEEIDYRATYTRLLGFIKQAYPKEMK